MFGRVKEIFNAEYREEQKKKRYIQAQKRTKAETYLKGVVEKMSCEVISHRVGEKYMTNYDKRSGQGYVISVLIKYEGRQYTFTDEFYGIKTMPNSLYMFKHLFTINNFTSDDIEWYGKVDFGMDIYTRNRSGLTNPAQVPANLMRLFGEEYESINEAFLYVR